MLGDSDTEEERQQQEEEERADPVGAEQELRELSGDVEGRALDLCVGACAMICWQETLPSLSSAISLLFH